MLAALDSDRSGNRQPVGENLKVKIQMQKLLTQLDFPLPPGTFSFSGLKFVANRLARCLATQTRNSIVHRFLGFQRNNLRDRIKEATHSWKKEEKMSGLDLEMLLSDLQFFLKFPANRQLSGDYSFQAPHEFLNTIVHQEFAALPTLPAPTANSPLIITKKFIKKHFALFLPYITNYLKEVEGNVTKFAEMKAREKEKEIETGRRKPRKRKGVDSPFIGRRKLFSIIPLPSFTRASTILEPSSWAQFVASSVENFSKFSSFSSFLLRMKKKKSKTVQ